MARGWRLLWVPVVAYLAAGVAASYRAYLPVTSLEIRLAEPVLADGVEALVDTVSSGRGPVDLRLEVVQGARSTVLAVDRIRSHRWAYWDPRSVSHSMRVPVRGEVLADLEPGRAVLRATAVGAPAWLRQPPPVVRELVVEVRRGTSGVER